ncbi:hypothetical protein RRG08_019660 [Elysia crispata]|uniref:Fucolectin-related molecule n=1 Tax=Elysia crispata TaxID=231223 RepID=A0AAE1CVU8_9GAST|nr:hypothetical protein RRG08_019660 [Elysia crispata]
MAFSLQVLAFILLCSAVSISICYGDCPQNDWFGDSRCPYQCHCEDNRNCGARSGVCSDRCKLGWFGPSCQYLSSEFSPAAGEPEVTWLADDNHMTCNVRDDQTIAVALRRPHLLTWVRVRVRDTDGLESLQLGYRTLDQPDKDVTCMDAQMTRVDDMTIDIACRSSVVVGHVTLSGRCVKHLCSLHISAGRNVALRQVNARQSSTFSNWFARNAVDGDIGPVDGSDTQLRRTCTHTDSYYQDAWWSLTFSTAVHLSEVVIYNRRNPSRTGCCEIRLVGFTLKAFKDSAEQNELYSYTDPRTDYLDEYYLLPSPALTEPVKKIKIFKSSNSEILTLCEVVALGENACPPGRFGLECERQCNCANQEATCFVSTGGCPSGCAAGYKGEDCWTECVRGRYGQECKEPCSEHCADPRNYCDAVTGSCLDGCIAGFQPPLCKEVLTEIWSKTTGP